MIDLGRTQRLFTELQRIALAVRDGGCVFPAWRSRHHHMLLHDNHWQITRDDATYWLKPPRSVEADQAPRLLRSKTRLVTELARHRD